MKKPRIDVRGFGVKGGNARRRASRVWVSLVAAAAEDAKQGQQRLEHVVEVQING